MSGGSARFPGRATGFFLGGASSCDIGSVLRSAVLHSVLMMMRIFFGTSETKCARRSHRMFQAAQGGDRDCWSLSSAEAECSAVVMGAAEAHSGWWAWERAILQGH